jgi:HAE1 family hydrophobic/amphiphilic exporter-1
MAFIPGLTGRLYNQFSLTIAIAVAFSGINSLSLSPALCAVFLSPREKRRAAFFRAFNTGFEKLVNVYTGAIHTFARFWYLVLLAFAGLCVLTAYAFHTIPKGFVPQEDQGYLLLIVSLPEGVTIDRTKAAMAEAARTAAANPGVGSVNELSGFNIIDQIKQPNMGIAFLNLKDWSERTAPELSAFAIAKSLQAKLDAIPEARFVVANAPPIPGLSSTAGFTLEVQDLNNLGVKALNEAVQNLLAQARKRPELGVVYTTFNADFPELYLDIDRTKVLTHGVSMADLFDTLQANLGSLYVNDFNQFGRVYRVYIQAKADARAEASDLLKLYVRNDNDEMLELSTFINIEETTGPYNIPHYDLYPAIAVQGEAAPGFSSDEGIRALEEVAAQVLPQHYGTRWTGLVYQQIKAGDLAPLIFGFSVLFVFLVLAALYESWTLPVAVLLGVPLGMLGAVGFLLIRDLDLDVFGQIGLVVLIGLVAKNGILIAEFAQEYRKRGASVMEAATMAARIRLRPILMTALAFIIGLLPLVLATGAGANARRSLGTTVVGGLAVATVLIMMVPVFYYLIERLREGWSRTGNDATEVPVVPKIHDDTSPM